MRRALSWLDEHFEEALLVALLVVIAVVELMQVVARNVPFVPALKWAEELCRFCWIASVFISLPYTVRKGSMLRVTALVDLLPAAARSAVEIVVDLVNAAAMGLLGWFSVGVFQNVVASAETSPAMLLPMWVLYLVVMLGLWGAALRSLQQAWRHVRSFGRTQSASERAQAEAAEELAAAGAAPAAEGGAR